MRKINIVNSNEQKIQFVDDWSACCKEHRNGDLTKKRSVLAVAKYFLGSDGFVPKDIDCFLTSIGVDSDDFKCIPRKNTYLPKEFGIGGPRTHDVLLWNEDTLIGIEAKCDEELDKYVIEKLCKKPTENQRKRYEGLCDKFLGKNIKECSKIKYQLLSATCGVLTEAKNKNCKNACLIVIVFVGNEKDENNLNYIEEQVNDYKSMFKGSGDGPFQTYWDEQEDISLYISFLKIPSDI